METSIYYFVKKNSTSWNFSIIPAVPTNPNIQWNHLIVSPGPALYYISLLIGFGKYRWSRNPNINNRDHLVGQPSRFTWAGKAYWATAGSFSISSIQRVRTGTLSTGNTKSGSFWKIKTQFRSVGFTFDFYLINTSITGDPLEPRPQHVIQPWLNIFAIFLLFYYYFPILPARQRSGKEGGSWVFLDQWLKTRKHGKPLRIDFLWSFKIKLYLVLRAPSQSAAYFALTPQSAAKFV